MRTMSPNKRRRAYSPAPAGPCQPDSVMGLLTPPHSTKKPLRHSLRNNLPSQNLLASFSQGGQGVKDEQVHEELSDSEVVTVKREEVSPEKESGDEVIVKVEEKAARIEDLPLRVGRAEDEQQGHENIVEENNNAAVKNEDVEEHEQVVVKPEDEPKREDSPPIKEDPDIKPEDPDIKVEDPDDRRYRFPFHHAPYDGKTIDEVPDHYLRQLSDNGTIDGNPALKEAVIEWAANWTFTNGAYWGRLLEEVPISYMNKWILNYGKRQEPKHDGLCVAWKYHLPFRTTEVPGSLYRLMFGPHKECTLKQAIEASSRVDYKGNESNFILWCKAEGVPEQDGYEDFAEAVELLEREALAQFVEEHPDVVAYKMPEYDIFEETQNLPITEVPEYAIDALKKLPELYEIFPGLEDAIKYYELVQNTCRWNWRRERGRGEFHGMETWTSLNMALGPLLYPTTEYVPIKEAGLVVSGGMMWERIQETYYMNGGREGKKWVWRKA